MNARAASAMGLAALALVLVAAWRTEACSVIAVGKGASKDGSVMVTHTDDMGLATNDLRLVRVPHMTYPKGSMRAVYQANDKYPRLVSSVRAPAYFPKEGEVEMTPLGYIPQVAETFAYFDQDYGIINEAQLIIAETTVAAKTAGWSLAVPDGGKNMMCIEELTKIAMERCRTARCAVQTMGDLAVQYGYFNLDAGEPSNPAYSGSAEALAVGDGKGEVWLFHVLTGPNNSSAVWAAQRVPDDHIAVMANSMVIRQMDLDDPDNFLASDNVMSFAQEQGWWDPRNGPFDFTAAYALDDSCADEEWKFPLSALYSGRRTWRVYDLLAPSLKLDDTLGWIPTIPTYPFSVKPDTKVDVARIMGILRDNYDGTKYYLGDGIKGGPFSSPLQYDPGHDPRDPNQGGWERAIASYRMLFSFVAVARPAFPDAVGGMVWYGQARSTTTVYVPFYAGHNNLPVSYTSGLESEFNTDTAWWAFSFVQNIAQIKWSLMFKDILAEQQRLENDTFKKQSALEESAMALVQEEGPKAASTFLEKASNERAETVLAAWWKLGWGLMSTYSNGFVTHGEAATRERPGYPLWWLKAAGYEGWPGDTFTDPRTPNWCGNKSSTLHALAPAAKPDVKKLELANASAPVVESHMSRRSSSSSSASSHQESSDCKCECHCETLQGMNNELTSAPVAGESHLLLIAGFSVVMGSVVGFAAGAIMQAGRSNYPPISQGTQQPLLA